VVSGSDERALLSKARPPRAKPLVALARAKTSFFAASEAVAFPRLFYETASDVYVIVHKNVR